MSDKSKKVTLKNVVLHFVNVLEPVPSMGNADVMEYSCRVVIPQGHPQLEEFANLVQSMESELPSVPEASRALLKAYGPEDTKVDFARFPEYDGGVFFRCKTRYKPQLLNPQKEPANDFEAQQWMWNGAVCHVSLNLFSWSNKFGAGVSANLRHLMLTGKGKKSEGSSSAANDFAEIEVADDAPKTGSSNILDQIRERTGDD